MGIGVGIDLGTTNSCMAVVQANRAKVVADQAERRIHPSVVSFSPDEEVLAGHTGKDRLIVDPENTVYSFKRLIGRDVSSPEMQHMLADLSYKVHMGPGDIPTINVREREVSLPEVSAIMLRHLRQICGEMLGVEIKDAVITVPANFDDVQRSLTKVAGRIAGFNVLRILNEPTAAALAYGFGGKLTERIAIYDFGGGTFDITIVELADDIFEVLSTAGDTYLGGDDLDKEIVEHMRSQFTKNHDCDLTGNHTALQRIRSVAERVKCQLSSITEVQATLHEIAEGSDGTPLDFDFKLNRPQFEKMAEPYIERTIKVCDEALKLAGLDRSSLDNLVFVGGSTRVPLVRSRIAAYFGMKPRTEINPDEVVAIGAAIQAFSLTGEQLPEHLPSPTHAEEETETFEQDEAPAPPMAEAPESHPFPPEKPIPPVPVQPARPQSSFKRTVHGLADAAAPKVKTPLPSTQQPVDPKGLSAFMHGEKLDVDVKSSESQARPERLDESYLDPGSLFGDIEAAPDVKPEESLLQAEKPGAPTTGPQVLFGDIDSDMDMDPEAPTTDPQVLFGDIDSDTDMDLVSEESPPQAKQPGAPKSDEEDLFGEIEFDIDVDSSVSPSEAKPVQPVGDGETSDDFPVVLSVPPDTLDEVDQSKDSEAAKDVFGALKDVPLPGAEKDAVVGIPSPEQQSLDSALSATSPSEEASEIPVPVSVPVMINVKPALLLDVTPRSLGVATAGGFCDTVIERNAAIPVEQSRLFTTSTDNQTEVSINIYQGESRRTEENTKLGQVQLTNVRPALRGEIKVRVVFEIDTNGILGVSAGNEETGEAQNTRITLTGGMDNEKIEELVEKYAEK